MDLQNIIRQHGKSVAVVFKRMGINAPITAKDVMLVTLLHGDSFVNELEKQVENDSAYVGFDSFYIPGLEQAIAAGKANQFNQVQTLPDVRITAKAKSSKVKNTLNDLIQLVAGGLGTYSAAKNANNNTGASNNYQLRPDATPITKNKNKMLLIGGIVLIVILGIVVLTRKNK